MVTPRARVSIWLAKLQLYLNIYIVQVEDCVNAARDMA